MNMSKFWENIWMILMLDCQGSAELTSESFDRELLWAERLAIRLHCLICGKSRMFNKQLTLMNQAIAKNKKAMKLSDEAKARMAKNLDEALNS